jgi:hypothetical protein
LQFAQANAQTKNCKRASTSRSQERISNYFFQRSKKNKTPETKARQKSTRQMKQTDDIKMVVTHDRQERQPITAPTRNWRSSVSYDSFKVNQTVVLRINICDENPTLRQTAKRFVTFLGELRT